MYSFKAEIKLLGINPYVSVPKDILKNIFFEAGKDKGHIPIKGTVNQIPYKQTLVKYQGAWRLYINTTMLANSPERIGEEIQLTVEFDPSDRSIKPHPKLIASLNKNKEAKNVFETLSPSKQNEIVKYISKLKTEESREKNIKRAINFLLGKERFIGRDKP
jgi:hypothetical protein